MTISEYIKVLKENDSNKQEKFNRIRQNKYKMFKLPLKCEKCNCPTHYKVLVVDRWAAWCGCGN